MSFSINGNDCFSSGRRRSVTLPYFTSFLGTTRCPFGGGGGKMELVIGECSATKHRDHVRFTTAPKEAFSKRTAPLGLYQGLWLYSPNWLFSAVHPRHITSTLKYLLQDAASKNQSSSHLLKPDYILPELRPDK